MELGDRLELVLEHVERQFGHDRLAQHMAILNLNIRLDVAHSECEYGFFPIR